MHALIIDDSRAIRRILRRIVEPLGFSVLEAEHGQDGLKKLHEHIETVELILVDWNMPVMDGLQFVKALRADPAIRRIPIVMVTTETEPAQMARALMAGVDEFVMKPFTVEILTEKLALIGVRTPTVHASGQP
ncbi:MAG: response regulator [Planctomycetaceae bacterium]